MENNVLGTSICPKSFEQAASRHGRFFARYQFAGLLAGGKRVLDAACGSGFGSAWLARTALSVLGMDLDDDMLRQADHWAHLPNLRFRKHDLNQPLEAALEFDLIVSFETLEHVRDPYLCLANMTSRLTPEGQAVVSIPNGTKELRDGDFEPTHLVHYSASQFEDMMRTHFEQVEFFSQVLHRGLGHYVRKLLGKGKHHAADYRFLPGLDDQAKTWVARGSRPRRPD